MQPPAIAEPAQTKRNAKRRRHSMKRENGLSNTSTTKANLALARPPNRHRRTRAMRELGPSPALAH
eukprot:3938694-Rhodomonas_salina.1